MPLTSYTLFEASRGLLLFAMLQLLASEHPFYSPALNPLTVRHPNLPANRAFFSTVGLFDDLAWSLRYAGTPEVLP